MSLLSVKNLSLSFPSSQGTTKILKDVSFEVSEGEMLALVGESGSGKSLTALTCLGLQPPQAQMAGSILFDGQELLGQSEHTLQAIRGKRISMVFQEPMTALNPLHTIGRQISEILYIHHPRDSKSVQSRVLEVLEQVGLGHFKHRFDAYPHQLSGGERQRVMIAMAIANRPDLLIADEPTTAVDVTVQAKILELLKDLQREMGMAMLFITHDLTVVKRLADRVAVMSHGELVEQGKVSQLFASPNHAYTRHLLASEPSGKALPMPPAPSAIMACEALSVHYPTRKGFLRREVSITKAVDQVSLTVSEGMALGVVGESGSGKTTLGFALLRLIQSEGRIVFLGQTISQKPAKMLRSLRKDMQVVFQDPFSSLNPRMTIGQLIEEGLSLHSAKASPQEHHAAIDSILRDVGLSPDMKDRYPHQLSGGQRQRVSIARAVVLKPRFIVLDEPTSALDLSIQAQMLVLLKSLQAKYGLSYLFISHDLRVVRAIAHHIIVMHSGRIVEQGDTEHVFTSPKGDYTKALIQAAYLA